MPISYAELRAAAQRPQTVVASSLSEARRAKMRTAFLCHSHLDNELVRGFVAMLAGSGFDAYVDWLDNEMPAIPDRETARRIKERIVDANLFLFLATRNSVRSRWCPWEIGYADGVKPTSTILVASTSDDDGRSHGNEYLQLYRRFSWSKAGLLRVYQPGRVRDGVAVASL